MTLERLDDPASAAALPTRVRQAVEWLRRTDLRALPTGRHAIDGDRVFALVQQYTTRVNDECRWEAHRMYTDVQCVVTGIERMGVAPLAAAREQEPYDAARDVAFFEPGTEFITVTAGMFAVFTPDDVHAPCGAAGKPAPVRKIVVKVAVES